MVDGSELITASADFTLRLHELRPGLQALFSGRVGALLWRTAVLRATDPRDDSETVRKILVDGTRKMVAAEHPGSSTPLDIEILGAQEPHVFTYRAEHEDVKVCCKIVFRTGSVDGVSAHRLRVPLANYEAVKAVLVLDPLAIAAATLLRLATIEEELRQNPALHQFDVKSLHKARLKLEKDNVEALHASVDWDTLALLLKMFMTVRSPLARRFPRISTGFPLSSSVEEDTILLHGQCSRKEEANLVENFVHRAGSELVRHHPWLGKMLKTPDYGSGLNRSHAQTLSSHFDVLRSFSEYFPYKDDLKEPASLPPRNHNVDPFPYYPTNAFDPVSR
ncbi:hypothetical protein JCM16303_000148 [Sporobolomyces ruberrimus]